MSFKVLDWYQSVPAPAPEKRDDMEIVVVLDRSGSMSGCQDATIKAFNDFVKNQQEQPGRGILTLAQFDDVYEMVHERKPLVDVPPLTSETFKPRGATALLDAIGRTINTIGEHHSKLTEFQRPARMLLVLLTDGHENASEEFTPDVIKTMVEHCEKEHRWEFVFLGADMKAIEAAPSFGLRTCNTAQYAATSSGYENTSGALCSVANRMRGGGTAAFTDDERDAVCDS